MNDTIEGVITEMKEHPEEWCNCDKCVCKLERAQLRDGTLKAALLRIRDMVLSEKHTDTEKLTAIGRMADCALARDEMHNEGGR